MIKINLLGGNKMEGYREAVGYARGLKDTASSFVNGKFDNLMTGLNEAGRFYERGIKDLVDA